MYLTGYSHYLTGFREPLSPPYICHTDLKTVQRDHWHVTTKQRCKYVHRLDGYSKRAVKEDASVNVNPKFCRTSMDIQTRYKRLRSLIQNLFHPRTLKPQESNSESTELRSCVKREECDVKATNDIIYIAEFRSCVKVEVNVLGMSVLTSLMVSVDVKLY